MRTDWAKLLVGVPDGTTDAWFHDVIGAYAKRNSITVSVHQRARAFHQGREYFFVVEFVACPGGPSIRGLAEPLARHLLPICHQHKITVQYPDITVDVKVGQCL